MTITPKHATRIKSRHLNKLSEDVETKILTTSLSKFIHDKIRNIAYNTDTGKKKPAVNRNVWRF
jgi:hypothetical protein